jgi:isopentenyl diphosphate isomerase/L-lactate dehydrogenase-like FMN-dependent dehydrogenase
MEADNLIVRQRQWTSFRCRDRKKVTLTVDSGIRRGSDVITALCVGAKFNFLGRAGLCGVSAAGLAGARRVIEILRTEIDVNLGQMGCPNVAALGWDFVHDQSRVTKG